jgi:ABC-type glycerol-3-phosphate transport system permease component
MTAARRLLGVGSARTALWLLAGLAIVPIYFAAANSIRGGNDYAADPGGLPGSFTTGNLSSLFTSETFYRWLANSVILTSASVALSLLAAIAAAYALTHLDLPGAGFILRAIAALMIVPVILLVVPLFVQLSRLGLIDTYAGAILIYSGVVLPFSIFLLARFFGAVPEPLLEAAALDGAGALRTLVRIIVPLTRPAIVTLAVVNAFFVWNDLLVALVFLQSDEHRPLMVGITTLAGRETQNVPRVMAAILVSIVPIVCLYVATQRAFVRSLYGGGVHGQ